MIKNKKLKQGLIIFASAILSAILVFIPTAEFSGLVGWSKGLLLNAGVPAAVVSALASFIAILWFHLINKRIMSDATDEGRVAAGQVDLY